MFSKKTKLQETKEPEYEHFIEFIFRNREGIRTSVDDKEKARALMKNIHECFLKEAIFYCKGTGLLISRDTFSHAYYRRQLKED